MSEVPEYSKIEFSTKIRIRYAETDQMGFCYYGNYASFFEVARVEALRERGIVYQELEQQGILLPVKKYDITYHLPAKYDELIEIRTKIVVLDGARIEFTYRTFNAANQLLNEAFTQLVFVSADSLKPIPIPTFIKERLN